MASAYQDRIHITDAGPGDGSPACDRLGSLHGACAIVWLALLGAFLFGLAVYRWAPLRDPIDIVGVPLLTGYSERAEQAGWFSFIVASLLFTGLLSKTGLQRSAIAQTVMGPLGLLSLILLPAWSAWPSCLPVAAATGVLLYVVASYLAPLTGGDLSRWAFRFAGLLVWSMGFPYAPRVILAQPWLVATLVVGILVVAGFAGRSAGSAQHADGWLTFLLGSLVVVGVFIASMPETMLGLTGAICYALGVNRSRQAEGSPPFSGQPWLLCAFALVACAYTIPRRHEWDWWAPLPPLLGGAGVAALFVYAPSSTHWLAEAFRRPSTSWRSPLLGVPLLCLMGVTIAKPWFGAVVSVAAVGVFVVRGNFRGRWSSALALSALLLMAFLPAGPAPPELDPFHDGQILSAVWEFESGRPLYSEVFPLRSFEFFSALLSRQVFGRTLGSYFLSIEAMRYLPIAAGCLACFSWTRSLAWSLATALVIGCCQTMEPRMGLCLLVAALALQAFRQRGFWPWWILPPTGWLAALAGYDVLIPFIAGVVAAMLMPRYDPLTGRPTAAATTRIAQAALILFAIAVPFSAALAAWQGIDAAFVYWRLVADYSRNYPAFYGLPLPREALTYRPLLMFPLVVAGAWAAGGVLAWRTMTGTRRRCWAFLFALYALLIPRALGRSDYSHLVTVIYPTILLGSILLFELLKTYRRSGQGWLFLDRKLVACWVSTVAVWITPYGLVTPGATLVAARRWLARHDNSLSRSAIVDRLVSENDYLWDWDDGLLNYVHRRHNPTRHAIAYCIGSVAEQQQAIADLKRHPPKLIAWRTLLGSDEIATPLRHYVMAPYLYRNYRPMEGEPFLEPAPPDWPGFTEVPAHYAGRMAMRQLPFHWGQDRAEAMRLAAAKRMSVRPWRKKPTPNGADAWEMRSEIRPRDWNYLAITFSCELDLQRPNAIEPLVTLEWAPHGQDVDRRSPVTFQPRANGVVYTYLVPIGCSPAWSWRPAVDRLRVELSQGLRGSPPKVECWSVDESGLSDEAARQR